MKIKYIKGIYIFRLRGGINYKELGIIHKIMMAMLKRTLKNKKEEELTEDDKGMLETYGDEVNFTDKVRLIRLFPMLNLVKYEKKNSYGSIAISWSAIFVWVF